MCLALRFYRCSVKFLLKVGVEELIVNAPRISCLNTLLPTSGAFLIDTFYVVCVITLQTDEWCVHNRLFNANFEEKFK
jgi:hypothetical protein